MKIRLWFDLAFVFLVSQSCSNILSQSAVITDDSLLVSAQISMNSKDYTSALADFKLMSAAYLAQRNIVALNASAYAGRCGLEMAVGSASAIIMLMSIAATSAGRTTAENLLLGLVEFQRIGAILGQFADRGGSGNIDSGFDACLTTKGALPAATGLPVVEAQFVSASLMIGFDALSASGISAFSSSSSSFQTYCTKMQTYTGGANPCTQTAPTSFTNPELAAIMGLVKTNFFGIGTCADTTLATCVCSVYP